MSEYVLLAFELVGVVAFAVSGAITAIEKRMDIFGVITLGLTTAVGGGVIRDLLLGITPPVTFQKPIYAALAAVVSIIIFILAAKHTSFNGKRISEVCMLIMDSIGLGIFTVIGTDTAYNVNPEYGIFLLVFVGVVTGVGGGIMRDIMAGNPPYVFVKHFYACASLIGAVLYAIIRPYLGRPASMLLCTATVIILRLCAAHFRWSLPKPPDM